MARKVAVSTLNASTIDILNVIRQNATAEYQSLVPVVNTETDIPKVGEVLFGYPALANQFINALVNRIAAVRVKSAVYNNGFAELKKGYLEFGESIEEVFVNIAKAREFSAEKAEAREFKRSLPDVRSAFHVMNWRVMYPVTIQDEDLRMAFLSMNGVQDLIARIVDSIYTAAEYDEYLLFKHALIKNLAHGKMYPVAVDTSDIHNAAVAFRGTSNRLTFMNTAYNEAGVHTTTPKADQYIFMSADFNAQYSVQVLSAAFNMSEAEFSGKLKLIDDFTTFDNDRFSEIVAGSDQIDLVTDAELALMADVVAVLVDGEFFQFYDNNNKFTEKYVASGLYWNYFYHVWKTCSVSPFSNAVVFVASGGDISAAAPASFKATIASKDVSAVATVYTLAVDESTLGVSTQVEFVQTQQCVQNGIAIQPYGAVILPASLADDESFDDITLHAEILGTDYTAGTDVDFDTTVGTQITFTKTV